MRRIKAQINKFENSFRIIIPNEIIESEKLKENDEIEILIMKQNNVLKETFGSLKGRFKKTAQEIKDELREELYAD